MNFSLTGINSSGLLGNISTLSDLFNLIWWLVFGIGLSLGILFVIIGGIKFITSNGDESKFTEARDTVVYAIIGIIVIIAFQPIINLALHILGSGDLNSYLSQNASCTVDVNFKADVADDPAHGLESISCALTTLIVALRHIAMAIGMLFAIIAGIKYNTAAGNPDKLASAQQTLTWAIAAVIFAAFFWVIFVMLANIFGLKGVTTNGFQLNWALDWLKTTP